MVSVEVEHKLLLQQTTTMRVEVIYQESSVKFRSDLILYACVLISDQILDSFFFFFSFEYL